VTIAKRPLCAGGDAKDMQVICVKKPEYYCEGDWTGVSVICPPGVTNRPERSITIAFILAANTLQNVQSPSLVVVVTKRSPSNK
jgi:hypothetical protein